MGKRQWFGGVCAGIAFWLLAASPGGFVATAAESAGSFRLSFAPYAKISARRVETMRLTREGKFDAVEALLTPLQQAYERGEVDELAAATAFAPFSTSDETLLPALDRWVAQAPRSYSARLARARYLRQRFLRYRSVERPNAKAAIGEDRVNEIGQRSISDYQAALAMNPRLMIAYGDLVEMAWAMGDSALLRETYRKALEISPATWPVRDALLRNGAVSRDKLSGFLADAAKHEQANPLLLQLASDMALERADQLWRQGHLGQALEIYDAQARTLDTFGIHKNRARLFRLMKRDREAMAAIGHAIELMPGKYDGYRERGWVHSGAGRWAEAVVDFRRGLEIDPLEPELNRGLGEALEQTGDIGGSLRALEISARWAPSAKLYQRIGWLYLQKADKATEAVVALDRAVALDPKDKWSWYKLAEALDRLGSPRARESYERYLELVDPRSPEDQKYIAWAKHRMSGAKEIPKPPANAAR